MTCNICGGDHGITHCSKPHNHLGQIMTSTEQNDTIKDGFLIVEIKNGNIILPKNLD